MELVNDLKRLNLMYEKKHQIVILGAGISSLTAAYILLKNGIKPILIEKSDTPGGLMKSVVQGDFCVDLGRKELYSRIDEVNVLWSELLGINYKEYTPRVGVLYNGRILEMSPNFRGWKRGMSTGLLLSCLLDFLISAVLFFRPKNYQDYRYKMRGRMFSRIFAQNFHENFYGRKWINMPVPKQKVTNGEAKTMHSDSVRSNNIENALSAKEVKPKHPDKGAGQITDVLITQIIKLGGEIWYGARVNKIDMRYNEIHSISLLHEGIEKRLLPQTVISSLPIETMATLLFDLKIHNSSETTSMHRGVILIYLFINEPSQFPHVWINVSRRDSKLGRITNYSNFGGSMVPVNKSCLCLEYFVSKGDELFSLTDEELFLHSKQECLNAKLYTENKFDHYLVIRLPNANAAVSWSDFSYEPYKQDLYIKLKKVSNLYNVNRAGTDRAAHAGIKAAEAILLNNKELFERVTDATKDKPWQDN